MATIPAASSPRSFAAPAFLLSPASNGSLADDFHQALAEALLADARRLGGHMPERRRIANLLCEIGARLRRARGSLDAAKSLPLSRAELAAMLGVSLARVKRTLALLSLSGMLSADGDSIAVTDWPRLCSLAQADPAGLGIEQEEEPGDCAPDREWTPRPLTAAGDPACFV